MDVGAPATLDGSRIATSVRVFVGCYAGYRKVGQEYGACLMAGTCAALLLSGGPTQQEGSAGPWVSWERKSPVDPRRAQATD